LVLGTFSAQRRGCSHNPQVLCTRGYMKVGRFQRPYNIFCVCTMTSLEKI
jgi:hypothetical protein